LSTTESIAERWPVATGSNVTAITHALPAFNVPAGANGQLFVSAKSPGFAPVKLIEEMASGAALVFFSVTFCAALGGGPTFCAAKVSVAGKSETPGIVPVPLSPIICGDRGALSVIETSAESGPVASGWNVTVIVQLAPAPSVVASGHVFVSEKSLAFAPVIAMLEIDSAALPVFLSVTGGCVVVLPTLTLPKFSELAVKPTAGVAAAASVPASATPAVPVALVLLLAKEISASAESV